ncbi:hypothetical protein BDF14DRAFT_1798474 [Spinellus fusiger]|nr:hypothetical protein BDF14DRAFT_1798474 [Spinellus fusiger]
MYSYLFKTSPKVYLSRGFPINQKYMEVEIISPHHNVDFPYIKLSINNGDADNDISAYTSINLIQ